MDPYLLKQLSLFSQVPESEYEKLIEVFHLIEFPAQSILCREGESGNSMFFILSGTVEVVKAMGTSEERVLSFISTGDYVGEMSLLDSHGHRVATVRTLTPVSLLELTRADFDNLLLRWPNLAMNMLRELSLRMRDLQTATIRDLRTKNLELAQAYRELQAAQDQIIEKEKLERELQLAHQIQMSMLPSALPETHGFEFGAKVLPARAVGGDLYDFIPIHIQMKESVGVLIGDVSDKGIPAALFMALTRSLVRAEADLGLLPVQVLEQVNRHLLEMNKSNMFVTMLYGILTPETGVFAYARGGHEIPLIVYPDGTVQKIKYAPGQLLGIFPSPLIDHQAIRIPLGGALLLYTDGATDANNVQGDYFGNERLESALTAHHTGTAQQICDQILDEILDYQGAAAQVDDITLVAIRSK